MNATGLKAQLQQVQTAFWATESKARKARTEKSRDAWTAKREALRPQYHQLLAAYAEATR